MLDTNTFIYIALTLGFIHTILGPDHYLPLIALAKANRWSITKTFFITALCGLAHTLSSVLIGFTGILILQRAKEVHLIESLRGELAAWLLISAGLIYLIWGVKNAINSKKSTIKNNLAPLGIFIIFALGPCEPLIPLMMHPEVSNNSLLLLSSTFVFITSTICTMLSLVLGSLHLIQFIKMPGNSLKYSHVFAGATMIFCGIAMKLFDL